MTETKARPLAVGDLVTFGDHPPARGEIIAVCPDLSQARVRFANGEVWLPVRFLLLLARGNQRLADSLLPSEEKRRRQR